MPITILVKSHPFLGNYEKSINKLVACALNPTCLPATPTLPASTACTNTGGQALHPKMIFNLSE